MEKPVLTINGKSYEMQEPKARMWRTWTKFHEEKGTLPPEDFIDKHAELLAGVFDGVTADDILDNLDLADIMPLYFKCYTCLTSLLTAKLSEIEKNAGTEEEKG